VVEFGVSGGRPDPSANAEALANSKKTISVSFLIVLFLPPKGLPCISLVLSIEYDMKNISNLQP
jgi:hypothetical protein